MQIPQNHTIAWVVGLYLAHARDYYAGSREYANLRATLGRLSRDLGHLPASSLRAPLVIDWRNELASTGLLTRGYCNRCVRHVRRMASWAVAMELLPPYALASLQAVPPLKRGRCQAPEPQPVQPVSWDDVQAVLPHLATDVAAMVELMWLTGCRTGEARTMRSGDIDTTGSVWLYRPRQHKTAHHGHDRVVPLDEPCQALVMPRLQPFLPDAWVFPSPRGGCYAPGSIRNAVRTGCRRAGVHPWHPHQLRHAYLTAVRQALPDDPDAWRAAGGHAHVRTSELYAQADVRRAIQAQAAVRAMA